MKENINKFVGNIIATSVIAPDDISIIFKEFLNIIKPDLNYFYTLVNSCVIKINNSSVIKISLNIDNNIFVLPTISYTENDLNTFIDYSKEEVNDFIKKLEEILIYIEYNYNINGNSDGK